MTPYFFKANDASIPGRWLCRFGLRFQTSAAAAFETIWSRNRIFPMRRSARLSPAQSLPTDERKDGLARSLARSMYVALVEFRLPAEAPGGEGERGGEAPLRATLNPLNSRRSALLAAPARLPFLTPLSTFIASCSALLKHRVSLHF